MMRPFGRVAARIDSLIAGTNSQGRANHFVCRQCQERLRTRPTRTSLLGRATFSTRSPQRREFDAPESRDRDTSDVSRTDSENWEGLKWIGSKEWIEAREARQVTHDTFLPDNQLTDPKDIFRAIHRALVEVYTLVPVNRKTPIKLDIYPKSPPESSDETHKVNFKVDPKTTTVRLVTRGNDTDAWARFNCHDDPWAGLVFDNVLVKFAIIKRTMQLTGIRIPDATINTCSKPQALFRALTAKPKDIKVVDAMVGDRRLNPLDNVTIYGSSVTKMDKDQQLGRWKVVERELEKRGLPIAA